MGGTNPAVLGLLCLLILRGVLPGFAQEVSTNQSADFGTEVPAVVTISSIVNSTVLGDSDGSDFTDVTPGGKDNKTIAVTGPPPSEGPATITVSESGNDTSTITEAPQESSSSGGITPSHAYADPATGGVTRLSLTQPPPTTQTPTVPVTEDVTTGPPSTLTESPLLPSTSSTQTENTTETLPGSTQSAASTPHTEWTSAAPATTSRLITTAVTTTQPTSPATQTTATPYTSRAEVQRDPSVLEVGDQKEIPGFHSRNSSNPLFVMIVSVFTIMVVMVVVAVGFHRYKKRNRRTDFRRLQDLPMDDMMEDTPLALYSY